LFSFKKKFSGKNERREFQGANRFSVEPVRRKWQAAAAADIKKNPGAATDSEQGGSVSK